MGAIHTALTGIMAAQTKVEVVGNNLTNSETVGFKQSRAEFSSLYYQNLSLGAAPTAESEGSQPVQVGFGVKTARISADMTQGSIADGQSETDLAIQGEGYFVLDGPTNAQHNYSRNGMFNLSPRVETLPNGTRQETTSYMTNMTGQRLMGYPVDPVTGITEVNSLEVIQLDFSEPMIAQATSSVELNGNVIPAGDAATQSRIMSSEVLTDSQYEQPANALQFNVTPVPLPGVGVSGLQQYFVVFNDGVSRSRPSDASPVVSTANSQVQISNFPNPPARPGGTGGWNTVELYRTSEFSGNAYRLGEYSVNTLPGLTVTDTMTNEQLRQNAQDFPSQYPQLDYAGPPITANSRLDDVLRYQDGQYTQLFPQDGILEYTPEKNGVNGGTRELVIDVSQDRVSDFMQFLQTASGIVSPTAAHPVRASTDTETGGTINPGYTVRNGQMQLIGNTGVDNAINIDNQNLLFKTNPLSPPQTLEIGWFAPQEAIGESAVTYFSVYGEPSLATGDNEQYGIGMTMVREDPLPDAPQGATQTIYRWFADYTGEDLPNIAGTTPTNVGTGRVVYDSEGQFDAAATAALGEPLTVAFNIGPGQNVDFTLDFDATSSLGGNVSQVSAGNIDGYNAGIMEDIFVSDGGIINGHYTNNEFLELWQIPLAKFVNPQGLYAEGENMFSVSMNSGQPDIGITDTEGRGLIIPHSIELSNADISDNLVSLIKAATFSSSNTRVITTESDMFRNMTAMLNG